MRRRSMRGMGEDIHTVFNEQIVQYKQILISLYKQKTRLSAEREALRFQYLSGFKSKVSASMGRINSAMYGDSNTQGEEATRIMMGFMMTNIPMVLLNGANAPGWGANPFMVGGRLSVGLLSPLSHIFVEPFNAVGAPDQRPAYQIYAQSWLNDSQGVNWVVSYYYLPDWQRATDANGVMQTLSNPPTAEFIQAWLKSRGKNDLLFSIPYVLQMLTTDFGGGSFTQILSDGKLMFRKIVEQTIMLLRIQLQLDVAEAELRNFVDEFVAFSGQPIVLTELLASIKAEADAPEVVVNEVPVGATVVEDVVIPNIPVSEDIAEVPAAVVVEQKSSLKIPMMIAAAGAIFLATRK